MKYAPLILALLIGITAGGCHKARTVTNFGLKAGMTEQDVEDLMGSPDKSGGHWSAYKLKDGTELRMYFLEREKDGTRTLTHADVWTGDSQAMQITTVFQLPTTTAPSTNPASAPTTAP